jgi:hypothetical protein
VLLPKIDRFQNDTSRILERLLLTLRQLVQSYNFASPGYLERLNVFRKVDLMTEQNSRVLARTGARILTQAEMAEVGGGFSTSVIITDLVTNFGKDFSVDHIES